MTALPRVPDDAPGDVEEPLAGGNVSAGVVRVGDTVRRPAGPWTPAVHAVLTRLADVGFRHAPRSLGLDDRGRHVVEHVPGVMAHPLPDGVTAPGLADVGRLARDLHDALDGWSPPPDARFQRVIPPDREDLVIHHDLAPWNLVLAEDRLVLIDWDGCGPGTRTWDLAYAAHAFVPLAPADAGGPGTDAAAAGLRALADGYGLDDAGRERLARTLAPRTWSMHTLLEHGHRTGTQPWARLWDEGHGGFWRRDAEWVEEHAAALRAALTA
ncbi:phosphotransferase [Cellulomonas sp. 179-A 4D5 NHS]|uniref:phosphotransferase n=1 Tax=Cellulomonas sp. 179-A 4D5 NHS TaxID=3142378 RepID=UPI0039A09510